MAMETKYIVQMHSSGGWVNFKYPPSTDFKVLTQDFDSQNDAESAIRKVVLRGDLPRWRAARIEVTPCEPPKGGTIEQVQFDTWSFTLAKADRGGFIVNGRHVVKEEIAKFAFKLLGFIGYYE